MAEGGIDRKADEKIEFSTSKEVTVHPTFESMSLKGKNCNANAFNMPPRGSVLIAMVSSQ
jgi:hypothetical protein